jgi:hypothetical protein
MSAEIWNGNGYVYNGWPPKLLERGDVILFVYGRIFAAAIQYI